MGRSNHIYNSFISGEVTDKFFGRTDASQYNNSVEDIRNTIVHFQGGISRRPGTIALEAIKKTDDSPPDQVRIFPFRGTDGSKWLIIITDEDVNNYQVSGTTILRTAWRAYRCADGYTEFVGPTTDPAASAGANNYDFPTGPGWWDLGAKGINLDEIQYAQDGDVMVFAHPLMRPFKIIYRNVYLGTSHTLPHTLVPENWAFTQLAVGDRRLSNNGIFRDLTHERCVPYGSKKTDTILTFTADGGALYFGNGGLVDCQGILDITTPGTTIAAFTQDWVGRQIKLNKGAQSFVVTITGIASATQAYCLAGSPAKGAPTPPYGADAFLNVTPNLKTGIVYGYGVGAANDTSIEVGLWGDGDLGWPRTVCFFEDRLAFGGNKAFPDTVWFSTLNNIWNFDQKGFEQDAGYGTPTASDAFAQNMKEGILSQLRFLHPRKTIVAGTDTSEFIIEGPDSNQSLSLTNTNSNAETANGVAYMQALRYQNATIFLQRDKRTLREMVFNLGENSYQAANLSTLGEHLTKKYANEVADEGRGIGAVPGAIIAMCKQDIPYGIIWCIDNNGNLFGLTRDREQQVAAWHSHQISSRNAIDSAARVVSIATVQGTPIFDDDGEFDELFMIVKRVRGNGLNPVDGSPSVDAKAQGWSNYFVLEKMARAWERKNISAGWTFPPVVAPVYMDGTQYYASNVSGHTGIITYGFGSFGDTVTVVMNGYYLGDFTLDINRQIDISSYLTADQLSGREVWRALVGYNYIGRVVPVCPEVPAATGSSQGQLRRIDQLSIYFKDSLGCRFGLVPDVNQENTPLDSPEELVFPSDRDNAGDAKPLYTGIKTMNFPQGYDRRPQLLIESYLPFPCNISYIVARMVVSEG